LKYSFKFTLQPSNDMYGTFNAKYTNGHIHASNGHARNGDIISDKTPLNRNYEHTVTPKDYDEDSVVKYKPGNSLLLNKLFSLYCNRMFKYTLVKKVYGPE
jgi:hypothetical protein